MVDDTRVQVGLAHEYELGEAAVAALLAHQATHLAVTNGVTPGEPVTADLDVVLYDTFGRAEGGWPAIKALLDDQRVSTVAVFTEDPPAALVERALQTGAGGVLGKSLTAAELAGSLASIAEGALVVRIPPSAQPAELDWPGRSLGLTARQAELLILIRDGLTDVEIATALFIDLDVVHRQVAVACSRLGAADRSGAVDALNRGPGFRRRG